MRTLARLSQPLAFRQGQPRSTSTLAGHQSVNFAGECPAKLIMFKFLFDVLTFCAANPLASSPLVEACSADVALRVRASPSPRAVSNGLALVICSLSSAHSAIAFSFAACGPFVLACVDQSLEVGQTRRRLQG